MDTTSFQFKSSYDPQREVNDNIEEIHKEITLTKGNTGVIGTARLDLILSDGNVG